MNHGNQYVGRKAGLMRVLGKARGALRRGSVPYARRLLGGWHILYKLTPASTRRRWKCGR